MVMTILVQLDHIVLSNRLLLYLVLKAHTEMLFEQQNLKIVLCAQKILTTT